MADPMGRGWGVPRGLEGCDVPAETSRGRGMGVPGGRDGNAGACTLGPMGVGLGIGMDLVGYTLGVGDEITWGRCCRLRVLKTRPHGYLDSGVRCDGTQGWGGSG